MTTNIVKIPFYGNDIQTANIDGKATVALKAIVENLGLSYPRQLKKLKEKSWANLQTISTVAADGKNREMVTVDTRTLTMWLATIDENRVNENARHLVVAYQKEIADVIENYWQQGGAINPRATEHQMNALIYQTRAQLELCQAAKGLIHPDHLEAKARILLARGLGEAPVLELENRPLYVRDFLKEKNLSSKKMSATAGTFGKRVKAAYVLDHGKEPGKYDLNLPNGQIRSVFAYTEKDRPLMERIWQMYYGD